MNTTLRILAVAMIAAGISFQVVAQEKKVAAGIRAGVNVATLSNTNADFKADFYAGGILSLRLGQRYTLQPELIYTRQGANNALFPNEDPRQPDRLEDVTIQYLSLGVINKFYFVKGFHGLAGPSLDLKIGKNFPRVDLDDDDFGAVDLGIALGLGYTLPFGLTVEGRFKTGLLDAFNRDDFFGFSDETDRVSLHRVFQVGVSYSF